MSSASGITFIVMMNIIIICDGAICVATIQWSLTVAIQQYFGKRLTSILPLLRHLSLPAILPAAMVHHFTLSNFRTWSHAAAETDTAVVLPTITNESVGGLNWNLPGDLDLDYVGRAFAVDPLQVIRYIDDTAQFLDIGSIDLASHEVTIVLKRSERCLQLMNFQANVLHHYMAEERCMWRDLSQFRPLRPGADLPRVTEIVAGWYASRSYELWSRTLIGRHRMMQLLALHQWYETRAIELRFVQEDLRWLTGDDDVDNMSTTSVGTEDTLPFHNDVMDHDIP